MLRTIKIVALLFTLLWVLFITHFLYVKGIFDWPALNPYQADNICFSEDVPGATERFVQYTAVSCSNPRRVLAEPVGADFASLSFEDIDGDGKPEAIIESSPYKCKYTGTGCYDAYRIVLKICPSCSKPITIIKYQSLDDLHID